MKKSHASFWLGLAVILMAVVYSAVVFLTKTTFDVSAWILYGFTLIAFVLLALQFITISHKGSAVITDSAINIVACIYFALQFVFGGIVCMCFQDLPMTTVMVSEIILLAIYLIIFFIMTGLQSHSIAQERNTHDAMQKMRILENRVIGMAEQEKDPAKKQLLTSLGEAIHYCDVSSFPELDSIDKRIDDNITLLQSNLHEEQVDISEMIENIQLLIKERDRTALLLKK